MFEQYLRIKEEYPDALLFYRMGDFYELFFEDAETAARELQIALTSRNPNEETRIPMCGVPHHACEGYLAQLLDKGYKVAVCDQVEDPKQAKGLVKREVTRVLSPGTVVEDANLESRRPNYLAALYWDASRSQGGAGGLAWVDFSTGEWSGLHARNENTLWQWLAKLDPREILLPEGVTPPRQWGELSGQITPLPSPACFDLGQAADRILKTQQVAGLSILELEDKPELTRAAGALVAYLARTQKQEAGHLGQFQVLSLSRFLVVDEVTERNLELIRRLDGRTGAGTLRHVVDRTMTPMGGRLLESRLRQPFRELAPITAIQDAVAWLHDNEELRNKLRSALDEVHDLERLSTRIYLGRANPRDFLALRRSLAALPGMQKLLHDCGNLPGEAGRVVAQWDDLEDACTLLNRALADSPPQVVTEGGLFRAGYNPDLDELMELTEHGEARLAELLETERREHDLPKLKLGSNRVFGYYFELTRAGDPKVPDHFVRRQTLVNSERYITPTLKELEDKLLGASEKRKSLEYSLFLDLRDQVSRLRPRLMAQAARLACLDYWQSLAETARANSWTRPGLHDGLQIRIKAGRHPVIEAVQGASDFVPNDLFMDDAARMLLITGPNMAGKSTVLRQTAIICLLAQMGSFVPAAEAELGLVDRIFCRVGASDDLARGQSTFMVEMMETARILRQATKRSLVVLDEIGRGTSTFDGLALAWAVAEELTRRGGGVRTLFATHYHELTVLENELAGVRNFNIAVKEWKGDIVFLRRLVPGPSDRSYGIEVARLAGVPRGVVQRAGEVLSHLERMRDEGESGASPVLSARQSLLPGLVHESSHKAESPQHPLLEEMENLSLDRLTPLQALNLLGEWKKRYSRD
jgi:DNA mismatch repair protein MutS